MSSDHALEPPPGAPIERYPGDERLGRLWLTREGSGKFPPIHIVEQALATASAEQGIIPSESAEAIQKAGFNIPRILELGGHDIVAYISTARETIPEFARGDFHRGATSFDAQDTGLALMFIRSAEILIENLTALRGVLIKLASKHKRTLMIGRTHGVHAKPITLAFKVLNWAGFVDRAIERLKIAKQTIAVGKMSGAVGVYTLPPEVEKSVCEILGLKPAEITTQIIPRDIHADFFHAIACAATACEFIATEVRNHHRTEVREFMEPFPEGAKGSSAMPHKRNPEKSEMVCGLARKVRNDMGDVYENIVTMFERSLEQSSNERLTHSEMIILTSHMVLTMKWVIAGLDVFPERMRRNMEITRGAIYSEAIQLLLRDKGVDPETVYQAVQSAAQNAMDGEGDMKTNILAGTKVGNILTAEELDEAMDPWRELQHVGEIYKRFGI